MLTIGKMVKGVIFFSVIQILQLRQDFRFPDLADYSIEQFKIFLTLLVAALWVILFYVLLESLVTSLNPVLLSFKVSFIEWWSRRSFSSSSFPEKLSWPVPRSGRRSTRPSTTSTPSWKTSRSNNLQFLSWSPRFCRKFDQTHRDVKVLRNFRTRRQNVFFSNSGLLGMDQGSFIDLKFGAFWMCSSFFSR